MSGFPAAVEVGNTALWVTLNPSGQFEPKKGCRPGHHHGLPSLCARADIAENGCMMAYGPGYGIEGKDGARYVEKMTRGQAGRHSCGAADEV